MADLRLENIDPRALHTLTPGPAQAAPKGKGFMDTLKDAVNKVEQDHTNADQAVQDLAVGRRRTLHETMIQVEKAEISFKMMMAVRGKLISAYQEIMRMHF